MKINKILAIMLCLTCAASHAYFWNDWGRGPQTQEDVNKRDIDLKYQEKKINVEQKKAETASHARKKQQDLDYKKSELELKRQREQLKVNR